MLDRNSKFLCTFSTLKTYLSDIELIGQFYKIESKRIYVLQSSINSDDVFLTFNAIQSDGKYFPRTISIHRKKDINTIYSINALNELVKNQSGGYYSSKIEIDWSLYKNSIITFYDGELMITPTKLLTIFILK